VAEVKIGKRRIIEFFVYPLVKYLREGMSVR
jgi:hemolysin D